MSAISDNDVSFVLIELFLYFLLGIFSGILAGLFGIGGGIIIIPVFFAMFKSEFEISILFRFIFEPIL